MNVQFINKDNQPEWVVIPYDEYQRLLELEEDFEDLQDLNFALANPPEKIPMEIASRLLKGENPILVWREYRRFTQPQLALTCHIDPQVLFELETRQREPSLQVLQKLARTLRVDLELLLEREEEEIQ